MMRDFGSNLTFEIIDNMDYLDIMYLNWCSACESKASELKSQGAQFVSPDVF